MPGGVPTTDAERYWDQRARENALFFVDNQLDYRQPDVEQFWNGGPEALDRILDAVGLTIRPDETIVDIGCGVGRMTRALASRAARVIGIDVSSEMIARAREYNAGRASVEWIHGDGRSLAPIADGSVDGCFSHVVFQHISDPDVTLGYIAEIGRVLRPGGWGAFVLSTNPLVHRRLDVTARARTLALALSGRGPRAQADPAWLGSAVEIEDLRVAAARAQLRIERMAYGGTQYTTVLCRRRG